jgi:hypothetical protein
MKIPADRRASKALQIYKQHYAHFRRMNDLLYKLPTLNAALIGGLWYFAYSALQAPFISLGVFLFAAVVCWYSMYFVTQFRSAFSMYLDRINAFEGNRKVSIRPTDPSAKRPMSSLRALRRTLRFAFAFSLIGATYSIGGIGCKMSSSPQYCSMYSANSR